MFLILLKLGYVYFFLIDCFVVFCLLCLLFLCCVVFVCFVLDGCLMSYVNLLDFDLVVFW